MSFVVSGALVVASLPAVVATGIVVGGVITASVVVMFSVEGAPWVVVMITGGAVTTPEVFLFIALTPIKDPPHTTTSRMSAIMVDFVLSLFICILRLPNDILSFLPNV